LSSERIPTGIQGLDDLIEGGLVRGDMHVVAGAPGTGKTIFAATFACHAATKLGEKVVYATFEESVEYFERNALKVGIDLATPERNNKLSLIDLDALKGKELETNVNLLLAAAKDSRSTILVIDSLTALLLACETRLELRSFMKTMYRTLRAANITTLLTVGLIPGAGYGVEAYVADSVMLLENPIISDQFRTRFMILKMRGTEHSKRYHSVSFSPTIAISKY
jgi:circadian clock protein KaiC